MKNSTKNKPAKRQVPNANNMLQSQHESQNQLLNMLETVHLIVIPLDMTGVITYVNPFLCRLAGLPSDKILGSNWFELFVPFLPELKYRFAEFVREEAIFPHNQNEIALPNGERRTIAWKNSILRDSQGRLTGIASIGEDITEKLRLTQELERKNLELESFFEQAPVSLILLDENGRVLQINRQTKTSFHVPDQWERGGLPGNALGCFIARTHPESGSNCPECDQCPLNKLIQKKCLSLGNLCVFRAILPGIPSERRNPFIFRRLSGGCHEKTVSSSCSALRI